MSSRPAVWEDVSRAALNWLYERLPQFRLPPEVTGTAAASGSAGAPAVDPATRPGSRELLLKPLAELAQLCVCVLRAAPAGSSQRQLAQEILDFAWQETGQGELFPALARDEPHAVHPVETYGPFAEVGLRSPEFEDYVRFLVTTRTWWLAEQQPTRALALLNARRRLGVSYGPGGVGGAVDAHPEPYPAEEAAFTEATCRTWLGGLAEPWAFEARTGYALTHHVFHVTNWGALPEQLSPETRDHLALWLPAWLDCCVSGRHWDLTGELLAVAAILPAPHAGAVPVAEVWEAYATAQAPDGAYAELGAARQESGKEADPGPEFGAAEGPTGWDDTFRRCYHATVVAALAAVLAAARHRGAATAVRPPAAKAGRQDRGVARGRRTAAPPTSPSLPVSEGERA